MQVCFFVDWINFDDECVSSLPYDNDVVQSDDDNCFNHHRHLSSNILTNEKRASSILMDKCEDTVTMESSCMEDVQDIL
ncbi:unnamed protein product [Rotaria sp. Silwood2]|nr:unnamed protein product [Rotaria sp. Silwood2]CAF3096393.1 unnamed protein product [Rotaria sp. Silwood2]CAF3380768.1 unnamed protein product [Rotaria sp. Silwood2]CAF3950886.1 unnamed protein product [Rotaria sp. Silwood2]CAF4261834.1 unnamed protein product [Rotaria sp. Silwood2]